MSGKGDDLRVLIACMFMILELSSPRLPFLVVFINFFITLVAF